MKDFYDLDEWKQVELLTLLLERVAENNVWSLEALAELENRTPDSIWLELCKNCGAEPCSIPVRIMREGHA